MSDIGYVPGVNLTALESSPVSWGGGASANILGTSANASGSDPAAHVDKALTTPPETAPKAGYGSMTFLESVLDILPESLVSKVPGSNKTTFSRTLIYSVVLVVIALLVFSRGLGMLGEEGAGVIVDMGDPAKYPGIGHAVQGFKGRKK